MLRFTGLVGHAQDIFLFQHLSKKQMADVVRVISRERVDKGDTVIKQGDEGDKFYIVDAGEFDVRPKVLYQRALTRGSRKSVSTAVLYMPYTHFGVMESNPYGTCVLTCDRQTAVHTHAFRKRCEATI